MTTIENVSPWQIEDLRSRAATEGDERTIRDCEEAIAALGKPGVRRAAVALAACVEIIRGGEIRDRASSGGSTAPAARECPTAPEPGMPCEPMPSEPSRCVYGEHPMPSR